MRVNRKRYAKLEIVAQAARNYYSMQAIVNHSRNSGMLTEDEAMDAMLAEKALHDALKRLPLLRNRYKRRKPYITK